MLMMIVVTGCLTTLAGAVGAFFEVSAAGAMIGGGAGMVSAGSLSKSLQANGENKGGS